MAVIFQPPAPDLDPAPDLRPKPWIKIKIRSMSRRKKSPNERRKRQPICEVVV
jgi:hypothetical protein